MSAVLRETLMRRADEGFNLVRFYGEYCDTCGTQSHASILSLPTLLAQHEAADADSPRMVERERAVEVARHAFDRGWAAAEACLALTPEVDR